MRIVEFQDMDTVLVAEVTSQPLDTEVVRDVALLRDDVAAATSEVSGIECWFKLSDDPARRLAVLRFGPFIVVQLILQLR